MAIHKDTMKYKKPIYLLNYTPNQPLMAWDLALDLNRIDGLNSTSNGTMAATLGPTVGAGNIESSRISIGLHVR